MNEGTLMSIIPIVVIGLIGVLIGGIAGMLIAGNGRPVEAEEAKPPRKHLHKALLVWRDRRTDKLLLELDGSSFATADRLSERQKTALKQILDDLHLWSGIHLPAARLTEKDPSEEGKESSETLQSSSPDAEAALLTEIRQMSLGPLPVTTIPKNNIAEKSIAAQIDEILQEKLPDSNLRNRNIRLVEIASRGMIVMVDDHSYEGVGEVPEPEVRQLIQECVTAWEQRS